MANRTGVWAALIGVGVGAFLAFLSAIGTEEWRERRAARKATYLISELTRNEKAIRTQLLSGQALNPELVVVQHGTWDAQLPIAVPRIALEHLTP